MGKPAHVKMQAKLDAIKRKMGIEDSRPNPFDYAKMGTRRTILNKILPKYQRRFAKSDSGEIPKALGSSGKNAEVIANISDERIIPKEGQKGYSYQRSELIRHSISTTPQSFDFPNNTRPDERILYEREMRQRARDVYAEVRAKAKAYREENKRINQDVSEAVQKLDMSYNKVARLLPRDTRLSSQAIVAEFQPLEGARVRATRGATNLADAVRACAETLEKMDKERQTNPNKYTKKSEPEKIASKDDDPERLNGNFALGDHFSSDTYDSESNGGYDDNDGGDSDGDGDGKDIEKDSSDDGDHKLPHFLKREVQPTYFEQLSFSLPIPGTMDEFQAMLDSVQAMEEILVLDRLIKSNSTLLNGTNRPEIERLAQFCVQRLDYLSYEAPELDPVRVDAQVRGLRHITTEIPDSVLPLYQKAITYHSKMVQRVRFMSVLLQGPNTEAENYNIKELRLDSADRVVLSIPPPSHNHSDADDSTTTFVSTYGRLLLAGVTLTNLISIVFPQGTYYVADHEELSLKNMRVYQEQPLYTGIFLTNDMPIQGLCMRLDQLMLNIDLAEVSGAELCSLYQEAVLLQLIVTSTLTLSNATKLYVPSITRGLETLLRVHAGLFTHLLSAPKVKRAAFQSIAAPYMTVGIPTEHKVELLPAVFNLSMSFTLGNILACFSGCLNACITQTLIAMEYGPGVMFYTLDLVCKELQQLLIPNDALSRYSDGDSPQKFTIEWALHTLIGLFASSNTPKEIAWIEDAFPQIKSNEPVYVVDFCPGKTLDTNKARERARIEGKREKKKKRDEERQARRDVKKKALIRTQQKMKLKLGREGATNRVQHMLETDQHSYKDLDAAKARLSKKRKS